MRELILASLLAAGVSSGGTYAVMQRTQPQPDTQLAEQVRQMTVTLEKIAWMQEVAYKEQSEQMNRLTILGRLQVKATTGKDPLDILQKIDATRLGQAN